jgi:hypothetical protein
MAAKVLFLFYKKLKTIKNQSKFLKILLKMYIHPPQRKKELYLLNCSMYNIRIIQTYAKIKIPGNHQKCNHSLGFRQNER